MMTDGIWTNGCDPGQSGRQYVQLPETATAPDPDITDYVPRAPFADAFDDTLATGIPLRDETTCAPISRTISYRCSGQHGHCDGAVLERAQRSFPLAAHGELHHRPRLSGYLNQSGLTWAGNTYTGSYRHCRRQSQWPQASSGNTSNVANVADLWHARSIAAASSSARRSGIPRFPRSVPCLPRLPGERDRLRRFPPFDEHSAGQHGGVPGALNRDWSGTLLALNIDASWRRRPAGVGCEPEHSRARCAPHLHLQRVRRTTFRACSNLATSQQLALNTNSSGIIDGRCTDRLNWLRGDSTKEERNGGTLRTRPTLPSGQSNVMGDVINSDPAYVADVDYGYADVAREHTGPIAYAAFHTAIASRTPMVYRGRHDGKLYGIRASSVRRNLRTLPAGIYGTLSFLTDPNYEPHLSVDGGITWAMPIWVRQCANRNGS